MLPQLKAAQGPLAEMPCKPQDRLAALRTFFTAIEPSLPSIISLTYDKMFAADPGLARLFKGGVNQQQLSFLAKLKDIVQFTRSSQLWPVGAFAGPILIPQVAEFGRNHAKIGVTPGHFALMKAKMIEAFRETAAKDFTPPVEEALAFVFDALARSLADNNSTTDVLSRLRLRPSQSVLCDPAAYFDEEMSAAPA